MTTTAKIKIKRQDKNQMRLKSYILNNSFAVKGFFEIYFVSAKNQNEADCCGRTENKFPQLEMRSDNSG